MDEETIFDSAEKELKRCITHEIVEEKTELPSLGAGTLGMLIVKKKIIFRVYFDVLEFHKSFLVSTGTSALLALKGIDNLKSSILTGIAAGIMTTIGGTIKIFKEIDFQVLTGFLLICSDSGDLICSEKELISNLVKNCNCNQKSVEASINKLFESNIFSVKEESSEDRIIEIKEKIVFDTTVIQ